MATRSQPKKAVPSERGMRVHIFSAWFVMISDGICTRHVNLKLIMKYSVAEKWRTYDTTMNINDADIKRYLPCSGVFRAYMGCRGVLGVYMVYTHV